MADFGLILIDKPAGITSFDVIRKLRKITDIKKIGHTGTLDPFATGLLPICIGKATRFAQFIVSEEKHYKAKLQFGIKTDTGDNTGETILESELPEITPKKLTELSKHVSQMKSQIPPKYSAIRVNGRKAYELARKGEEFTIPARDIDVLDFEVTNYDLPLFEYKMRVSKGTYIRVVSEDIARYFGCVATTVELRRLSIGKLSIEDSIKLDDINANNWKQYLLPLSEVLPFPNVIISNIEREKISYGMQVACDHEDSEQVIVLDEQQNMLCLAKIESGNILPKIVMI